MAHDVVLIPGDGIGPEITQAMRRVVEATGVQINWNVQEAGAGVMDEFGTPLPQHVLDAVAETKVAIKGPITTPVGTGFRSVNVALRKHFDLYACVRPCLSQPGDGSRFRDVDLVIVRENTEDLYAGIEFDEGAAEVEELSQLVERSGQKTFAADSAISIKPISIAKSRRDHVGIDHDQVRILLEHQIAIERPILVIQHRNRAARAVHRSRRGAYTQRQLSIKRNGLCDIEHLAAANAHHHVAILGLGFLGHFDNGIFRTRTVVNLKERLA